MPFSNRFLSLFMWDLIVSLICILLLCFSSIFPLDSPILITSSLANLTQFSEAFISIILYPLYSGRFPDFINKSSPLENLNDFLTKLFFV